MPSRRLPLALPGLRRHRQRRRLRPLDRGRRDRPLQSEPRPLRHGRHDVGERRRRQRRLAHDDSLVRRCQRHRRNLSGTRAEPADRRAPAQRHQRHRGFRHDDFRVSPPSGMYTNPLFTSTTGLDFAELKPNVVVRTGWARRTAPTRWTVAQRGRHSPVKRRAERPIPAVSPSPRTAARSCGPRAPARLPSHETTVPPGRLARERQPIGRSSLTASTRRSSTSSTQARAAFP